MTTTPEVRRKNLWLLLALVVFAVALSLTVYLWMRVKIRANGGRVDPTTDSMRLESPSQAVLNGPAGRSRRQLPPLV